MSQGVATHESLLHIYTFSFDWSGQIGVAWSKTANKVQRRSQLPKVMEDESKKVCIGDIVFLRQVESAGGAWVCAEGHLGDNVYASSVNEEFHNGLWEVYVQNQYSAMNELQEALVMSQSQGATDHGDSMLHQLERAAANEQKLNERMYQSKVGGVPGLYSCHWCAFFGNSNFDINLFFVSLKLDWHPCDVWRYHPAAACTVKALLERKFHGAGLSRKRKYARAEYSERRSVLILTIQPRVQMNMDGAAVLSGFDACIRVSERPGEYLRCANLCHRNKGGMKQLQSHGRQEVNCSLEKTVWTVNVYQSWRDTKDYGKVINAGDPISLSDAETFSYLSINESEVDFENNDLNATANAILKPPVLVTERELNVGVGSLWRIEKKGCDKRGSYSVGSGQSNSVSFELKSVLA